MMRQVLIRRMFAPVWLLVVVLGGCATFSEPVAPELDTPAAYATSLTLGTTQQADAPWWEGFDDAALNALIEQALDRNLDIAIALANLDRSRHLNQAAAADLLPNFDAFVDAQLTTILRGRDGSDEDRTTVDYSAGGKFAYDISFAGRDRQALRAAQARFRAAALTVADVRRLTAAAVADQYIAWHRAATRLSLLDETRDLQERTLRIVRARLDAGIAPALDVDRVRADLARAEAQRGLFAADQRRAAQALAVLLGELPGNFVPDQAESSAGVPGFKSGPAPGLPADLLRRRPDVRAAEESFIAAAAAVGVERADLYPTLRLPGTIPLITAASTGGFDAIIATLAAILDIPLFDGGRRRAELNAQQAAADAALIELRKSWLVALQEVENALLQVRAFATQRLRLIEAVDASRSAYRQLDALYREGLTGFIDVLDAQRSLISGQESVVEAEADYAGAIIALYTALGGDGLASEADVEMKADGNTN